MISSSIITNTTYTDFLDSLKKAMHSVFHERDELTRFVQKRGFPALVLRDIMATKPLSVGIPKEYGGRGVSVKECLGVMDTASYESLPLALTFGINLALFLEPVAKYAQDSVKNSIFSRFLNNQNMGGLMITEPDYGSDALSMRTSNVKVGNEYHIQGTKHWQGLTGLADYWLMTSRKKNESNSLERDIDFFVCDVQQPGQSIKVEEYYNNIGLYPIPYGKNSVDIHVPEAFKLKPETTGLKLMMDLLHRSRFQFAGMATGFIRRNLDEAIKHTSNRFVGGKSLFSYDQIQHMISRIQSAFTIGSAMCSRSSEYSGIENNLAGDGIEANSMKAYITDLMQESAQTLTQLFGANGYKEESYGARGIVDSRPFQIFEGSNDMLYTQLSEMIIRIMTKRKNFNLSDFFKNYTLTQNISDYFKSMLDFKIDVQNPQRKMVDLGKIVSKVVSASYVANMAAKGFNADLVKNCLETIKHEVSYTVNSFQFKSNISPIKEYSDSSSWLAFS